MARPQPGQQPATPESQINAAIAAIAAIPGSSLSYYELPRTRGAAAQVMVGKGADVYRRLGRSGEAGTARCPQEFHPAQPVALVVAQLADEDRWLRARLT